MTTGSSDTPGPNGDSPGEEFLFYPNRHLLRPGLRAPVLLAENTKKGFQIILRQLFSLHGINVELVEPATVVGASVLFGSQELILGCHDLLLSSQATALKQSCERIVTACREFIGNLQGIYVLRQASDDLARDASPDESDAEDDPAASCSRLKDLTSCLEDFFTAAGFEIGMSLERLGTLQFHLDEVYDHAARILESLYSAMVLSPARPPLARFCERCYTDVTRRMVPGHILDETRHIAPGHVVDKPPDKKESPSSDGDSRSTNLMELLPELAESV